MSLPSKEEFIKTLTYDGDDMAKYWNKGLYECPYCKGEVKRDYSKMMMTNPPKYRYFCMNKACSYQEIF